MRVDLSDDRFLEPPPSPMPSLSLPFGIAGAAAGWLAAGFIANPMVLWGQDGLQVPASLCGAAILALMGRAIMRWCRPKGPFDIVDMGRIWLVLAVLVGGVLTGTLTATAMATDFGIIQEGALLGLVLSIPFIPVCALVLGAARRAERARLGSIVAAADRREVWSILMACLSVATLTAVPDWIAFADKIGPAPVVAVIMTLGTGLVMTGILVADKRAVERVRRSTDGMEASSEGEVMIGGATVPKVDLGLGDEMFAKLSRHVAAYRNRDQAVAMVVGSPDQAHAALRRAIRRDTIGLVLCAAALSSHVWTAIQFGRIGVPEEDRWSSASAQK